MTPNSRLVIAFSVLLGLSACGGGLESNGNDNPDLPDDSGSSSSFTVDIGDDISANEQATITLTATVDGDHGTLSYEWTITPNIEDALTHSDTSLPDAEFTTPALTETEQYIIRLTATDNGEQVYDELTLTVNPVNAPPIALAETTAFNEDLYSTNQYPGGVEIVLDGSQSADTDSEGDISYLWSQEAGTDATYIETPSQSTTAVLLANLSTTETQTYRLTVTDTEGASAYVDLDIEVLADDLIIPSVDAGQTRKLFSGERFILYAQASSSSLVAEPYSYYWESAPESDVSTSPDDANQSEVTVLAPLVTATTNLIFQVTATDNNGNSASDTVIVTVDPFTTTTVPDTGFTTRATNSGISASIPTDYPGQDADYGRDAFNQELGIEKQGSGLAAFDFTKINSLGEALEDSTSSWSCIRDNFTGLIWEVKNTTSGSLHENSQTFTWYDSSSNNGGYEGLQSLSGTTCNITDCNIEALVTAVNSAGLCGAFDWRVPTLEELHSLTHFGLAVAPLIDTDYFPNTNLGLGNGSIWYWSSESAADGAAGSGAQNAWALDSVNGNDDMQPKSTFHYVRLVRAGNN